MAVAADPQLLTRYRNQSDELASRLSGTAADVTHALAAVRRTCLDDPPEIGPVGDQLADLAGEWRRVGAQAGRLANAFRTADLGVLVGALASGSGTTADSWVATIRQLTASGVLPSWFPIVAPTVEPIVLPIIDDLRKNRRLLEDGRVVESVGRAIVASGEDALLGLSALGRTGPLISWAERDSVIKTLLGPEAMMALGATATARDVASVYEDWSHHASGMTKAEDVTRTVFDGATTACGAAPNPWTCGVAAVAGLTWSGLEIWQHRKELALGARIVSTVALEKARDELAHLRAALERGALPVLRAGGTFSGLLATVLHGWDRDPGLVPPVVQRVAGSVLHTAADAAGKVESGAEEVGSKVAGGVKQLVGLFG